MGLVYCMGTCTYVAISYIAESCSLYEIAAYVY